MTQGPGHWATKTRSQQERPRSTWERRFVDQIIAEIHDRTVSTELDIKHQKGDRTGRRFIEEMLQQPQAELE
jgi:hypothetical protein